MQKHIIGIDHGYGYLKTVNSCLVAGVSKFQTEPPFTHHCVCYNGCYYVCGEERRGFQESKTNDEDYFILTLAGIAEELKCRGTNTGNVVLAAGLPLKYFSKQKEAFRNYLFKVKNLLFTYENVDYQVLIEDVKLYPQGYAIIAKEIECFDGTKIVVDIGSWTIDLLPVTNKFPVQARCESIPYGVINCIETIQKEYRRQFQKEVEENQIQEFLMARNSGLPKQYELLAETMVKSYCEKIINTLKQKKYNLEVTPVVYCGGGASIMQKFGTYDPKLTIFVTDIHANATGYEYLCKGILDSAGKNKGHSADSGTKNQASGVISRNKK